MIVNADKLREFLHDTPEVKSGCIVDSRILFAVYLGLPSAVEIFETLTEEQIPRFVSASIRGEFIDFTCKIIVLRALLDLLEALGEHLPHAIFEKIVMLKNRFTDQGAKDFIFQFHEEEILEIRDLFARYHPTEEQDLWDWFCEDYLKGKVTAGWEILEGELGVNIMDQEKDQRWKDITQLIEKTGGSFPRSGVIDLFRRSPCRFLVTDDAETRILLERLPYQNKFVVSA